MRSWRVLVVLVAALCACGDDADPTCRTSPLTYQTAGQPYIENWCRGCHGADVPITMRQRAPLGMNFDTLAEVRAQLVPIATTTANATMPPQGGPSDGERAMMLQWLRCGAP